MNLPRVVFVTFPTNDAEKDTIQGLLAAKYRVFLRVPDLIPNPERKKDPFAEPKMVRPKLRQPVFQLGIGVGNIKMERHAQRIVSVYPIRLSVQEWWSKSFQIPGDPRKDKTYMRLLEEAENDTCPESAYLDWDTLEWKCPSCKKVLKHRFMTCGPQDECKERSK